MMYAEVPYLPHSHRNSDNLDGRRQRMMYEQQHLPRKLMHAQGSLSQMDYTQYNIHQSSVEHLDSNWPPHSSPRHPSFVPPMGAFLEAGGGEGSQVEDIGFSNEETLDAQYPLGGSHSQVHSQSQLSQEPIELLQQQSAILSLNTLTAEDTLMSQRMCTAGLDMQQQQQDEEYLHYHHPQMRGKRPPPANRLGGRSRVSLSDLSALPGNSQSLAEMGVLSQSVQALQEQQQQLQLPQNAPTRQNKPTRSKSLHHSHEHLNRSRPNNSDVPQGGGNFYGVPGLKSSVAARIAAPVSSVTHDNGKRQHGKQQRQPGSQPHPKQQHPSTSSVTGSNTSSRQGKIPAPIPSSLTQPESSTNKSSPVHRRGSSTDTTNSDRSSVSPEGSSTSLIQSSEPRGLSRSGRR